MPGTVRLRLTQKPASSIISGIRLWKTSKQEGQDRSMKSSTTPSFWRVYRSLPAEIQAEATKAYRLWKENPRHPSLRLNARVSIGRCELRADGGPWDGSTRAHFTGSGLARTMSTKGSWDDEASSLVCDIGGVQWRPRLGFRG